MFKLHRGRERESVVWCKDPLKEQKRSLSNGHPETKNI
jgi:hypothetical protein